VTEDGFEIVRVFDAPLERVWAEWTEPEAFADWFGGPELEVRVHEFDVRPGGRWRATMLAPAREIQWAGEYLEVEPPRRLRLTFNDDPAVDQRAFVTVELTDLGGGRTEMRMEQRDGMTPAQHRAARSGWGGFFDRMEARLSSR
jgi:uncharacterized protein YndB with AHSA1/START domain